MQVCQSSSSSGSTFPQLGGGPAAVQLHQGVPSSCGHPEPLQLQEQPTSTSTRGLTIFLGRAKTKD